MTLTFDVYPHEYSILRFAPDELQPVWTLSPKSFVSITRTASELSIVLATDEVGPGEFQRDDGWRLLGLEGPIPFETTGVAAEFTALIASAGLSVFVIATFDTDYLLVQASSLEAAINALERGGHLVRLHT